MSEPSAGHTPTTFMSQRGMNPTTKLIVVGAIVVFMAVTFYLFRAFMMTPPEGQEMPEPAAATAREALPAAPGQPTTAASAAPATSTASAESAESAATTEKPVAVAPELVHPELVQPKGAAKLAPALSHEAAAQAANELPALKKFDIDFSKGEALLGDVQDGSGGYDEPAFYWLIRQVNQLPAELFKPDPPAKMVGLTPLWQRPNAFRGQPVTLSLCVGSIGKMTLPNRGIGVDTVWDIEAFEPPLAAEANVCTLIVTEDPGKLDPRTPFLFKGYFYKVRSYEKVEGDSIAQYKCPLLIGKTIEVVPTATEITGSATDILHSNSSLVIGAGLLLAFVVMIIIRRVLSIRAKMPTLQPKHELTAEEIAERVDYLKHEETAPPSALADEEIDPIELARRRDEALAKFEEQARKKKK